MVCPFLAIFLLDSLFGLRTLELRIAVLGMLVAAGVVFAACFIFAWNGRIDLVGLAHLLEKQHPECAERLVTFVQLDAGAHVPTNPVFVRHLEAETERQLATLSIDQVFPVRKERRRWLKSALVLLVMFAGLCLFPPFGSFCQRLSAAWMTPLSPFAIEVVHGSGYALRGESYVVEATVHRLDAHAPDPTKFGLVCEEATGVRNEVLMQEKSSGLIRVKLENLQTPITCHVTVDAVASDSFDVRLIEPPTLTKRPEVIIAPPKYLHENAKSIVFDEANLEGIDALRYSKMQFEFYLRHVPTQGKAWLIVSDSEKATQHSVQWHEGRLHGVCDLIATSSGSYSAELKVELEHKLSTTLPIGRWTIHDDRPPRFTESLRLQGQAGEATYLTQKQARISPDDVLRLQTAVEDEEGLDAVDLEYRVNDEPAQVLRWLQARGKKQLTINDWLPLPRTLKEGDRFRFRLRASDNRRLKKGEILESADSVIPPTDLSPQLALAPAVAHGEEAWLDLRVDQSIEGFLKQQILAQSEEVRAEIGKIKRKLQSEWNELQKLQRSLHEQVGKTPEQLQQAEKIKAANQEIVEDLLQAGERLLKNPNLAHLAEHFFDLAEMEMQKSAQALQRFAEKDLPQAVREKEVPIAQDAVMKAQQKLERMEDRNKQLAENRLDQWQLEKLAKRQTELADRLQKLLAEPAAREADMAKEIAAIRQEQARLADQAEQMRSQNPAVQQELATMQEKRVRQLAQTAQELAQKQRTMEPLAPDKMPKEIVDLVNKLAQRQADLAGQVQPFAQKNQGPKVSSAHDAASALKQLQVEQALDHQKDHEKKLQEWLEKMLPGTAPKGEVKDPALRARIAQVEQYALEQKQLRKETEKLLADWMKSAAQQASQPVREQTKKLEAELVELSQKGVGPEAKAMAKEAAQATDKAKQAMELSQSLKEKGQKDQAKMTDENAAKQLDLVVKQLEKFARDEAMKEKPKDSAAKTADALKESEDKMRLAQKRLPTAPRDAQEAMQRAAQRLEQAAEQANRESSRMQPTPSRAAAKKALAAAKGGAPSTIPALVKEAASSGKAWGELPGEMRTRLMQDFRTRYGEEYAEIIRDYFERLAETPNTRRK